jgi:hypothetical protein
MQSAPECLIRVMKSIKYAIIITLLITIVGCVNLKEVRDFAGESAKLSAYTELTTRFRDTYQREQPYVSGAAETLAKDNDKRRQDAYPDLLKIHKTVSLYMQTLATLAGDETFDLSKGMDDLASGIKTYPNLGIDEKHVDAFSSISKVVAKWITSAYQERAVREMVMDGDPHLQTLLDGMLSLVSYYKKTNDNERKSIVGFFDIEIQYTNTPKDKLLSTLAKAHLQSKNREYQLADARYAEAEKGIMSIKDGHKKIAENIDNLSSLEVKTVIERIAKDIKTIRDNIEAARS